MLVILIIVVARPSVVMVGLIDVVVVPVRVTVADLNRWLSFSLLLLRLLLVSSAKV